MAVQTGVLPMLAVPTGRLLGPVPGWLGLSHVTLTVGALGVLGWSWVRLAYRVLGTGSPSGQTPGKRAVGLRVVGVTDGEPPGYRMAVVRELVVHAELLTVVGLVGALRRRPLHDAVARTRVAEARPSSG